MQESSRLRDLVYFDFEKTASIFSQTEMGLLQETKSTFEDSKDERNIRKYGLAGIFTPEFGSISAEKNSILESKILHHDLLARVEAIIFNQGFAVDLNESIDGSALNCCWEGSEIMPSPRMVSQSCSLSGS